jgi:hypothetical protein
METERKMIKWSELIRWKMTLNQQNETLIKFD